MPHLAKFIAEQFQKLRVPGWSCEREARLLPRDLARRYGYAPQVDLLLRADDGRLVAIELEISRADPVANQVKFLLAYRANAVGPNDALVSMFSPHIARGRRNVAGVFARHLRGDGLPMFQVSLLPHLDPVEIHRLNQTRDAATVADLPLRAELDRVLSVVEPQGQHEHRIHFAGDVTGAGQFFVVDPSSDLFAPAKFCAFIPAKRPGGNPPPSTMTVDVYASLGEQDPRFDGHRARKHLTDRLAFRPTSLDDPAVRVAFVSWLGLHEDHVTLRHPVTILLPPSWYARAGT